MLPSLMWRISSVVNLIGEVAVYRCSYEGSGGVGRRPVGPTGRIYMSAASMGQKPPTTLPSVTWGLSASTRSFQVASVKLSP